MVITDELVDLIPEKNMLLAIYFHELGHLENRHAAKKLFMSLSGNLLLTVILGDVSGVMSGIANVSFFLSSMNFTRENELETDNFAIKKLNELKISPECFSRGLIRLVDSHTSNKKTEEMKFFKYLSSHPETKFRADNARKYVLPEIKYLELCSSNEEKKE